MSWGYLLREHAMTLWMRLRTLWLTRKLERKQRGARGIVGKREMPKACHKFQNGLHK